MNETQQEPDTDAEPTYHTLMQRQISEGGDVQLVEDTVEGAEVAVVCPEYADLLGTVGGAAEEIKEMGYDPVSAVQALPELLRAAKCLVGDSTASGQACWGDTPPTAYLSAKPGLVEKVSSALARAEGSKQ